MPHALQDPYFFLGGLGMREGEGEEAACCPGGLSASSRHAHPAPRPSLSSAGSAGVRKALRHNTTLAEAIKPSQAHQQRN